MSILHEMVSGGIMVVTLNRPDKLNAIGPDMLAELDRGSGALGRDTHPVAGGG